MAEENPKEIKERNYVFTVHIPHPEQLSELEAKRWCEEIFINGAMWPKCKFIAGQLERCPETGSLHLQGYLELTAPERFVWLTKNWEFFKPVPGPNNINNSVHFEKRRGTQTQAIDYAEKEESRIAGPWRYGIPGVSGILEDFAIYLRLWHENE